MAIYFNTKYDISDFYHTADVWEDAIYWNPSFNYSGFDLSAYMEPYVRNICMVIRLLVEQVNTLSEVEPPEVNMASIINAMLTADPEQVKYFVGLVDAYRQSLWNKPFNSEFYAALARGFEQWE